tara:strand:- start:4354 stop:4872 length:519 start_codon:yes stop_codon:yes gene_type:complete
MFEGDRVSVKVGDKEFTLSPTEVPRFHDLFDAIEDEHKKKVQAASPFHPMNVRESVDALRNSFEQPTTVRLDDVLEIIDKHICHASEYRFTEAKIALQFIRGDVRLLIHKKPVEPQRLEVAADSLNEDGRGPVKETLKETLLRAHKLAFEGVDPNAQLRVADLRALLLHINT